MRLSVVYISRVFPSNYVHKAALFMCFPPNQIMRKASETLIPVTLELGGKDAFIVCEDVDIEHVRGLCLILFLLCFIILRIFLCMH